MTKVLVATPTFDGKVCNEYLLSLMQSREQVEFGVFLLSGVHFLEMARDIAVAKFLQSDSEYLMFIDSDLGWQPDAIKQLVEHDRPVVGGAYRIKYDEELYPNYGVLGGGRWATAGKYAPRRFHLYPPRCVATLVGFTAALPHRAHWGSGRCIQPRASRWGYGIGRCDV